MSEENLAGIHLRLIQLAGATGFPGNDLETMVTNEHPQGALAWCNNVGVLFRLDKFSTIAADGVSVITAIGGGRWIAVIGTEAKALYSGLAMWDVFAGSATPALTMNTWAALPSAASNFSTLNPMSELWDLNTTSGVLTYSGPIRSFQFTAQLTAFATTGTTTNYGFGVSESVSPLIGTTTDSKFEAQQECAAQEERTWSITGVLVNVTAGQTVQGCVRNVDGTETLTVLRYSLVITPLG